MVEIWPKWLENGQNGGKMAEIAKKMANMLEKWPNCRKMAKMAKKWPKVAKSRHNVLKN